MRRHCTLQLGLKREGFHISAAQRAVRAWGDARPAEEVAARSLHGVIEQPGTPVQEALQRMPNAAQSQALLL